MPLIGVTKPDAGVITTRPATAPEIAPNMLGCPRCHHSATTHESVAAAAAKCVAVSADAAKRFAPSALPPLNPNQPIHNRPAPTTDSTRLCGCIGSLLYSRRGPITRHATKAATPDEIC